MRLSFYQQARPGNGHQPEIVRQIDQGLTWLVAEQNKDGGWGDTGINHSNISTAMLVVAAIHAAGRQQEFETQIDRAQAYVESQGGIPGLRARYGKDKTFAVPILANCAMSGIVDWRDVAALPFEAACVPQRFYNLMQLPVVSYAIPALVAIGQVKFKFDPPWDPVRRGIRQASIAPSLRVLEKMQPASGGYLEAVPLTSFVAMALIKAGKSDHAVVQHAIRFLLESFRAEVNRAGELADRYEPGDLEHDTCRSTHWQTVPTNLPILSTAPQAMAELSGLDSCVSKHPDPSVHGRPTWWLGVEQFVGCRSRCGRHAGRLNRIEKPDRHWRV